MQIKTSELLSRIKNPVLWIILLALIVRVIAAVFLGNTVSGFSGAYDEISYSMLGHRLAQGYGLTFPGNWYPWIKADAPQSYYSAAMSLYLGAIYLVFGYVPIIARLITAVLSTWIVIVLYLLARDVFTRNVAIVTAFIAAIYAYLIFYGVTLVTETPFILAILTVLYLTYEIIDKPALWKWIALGIGLAICVLFRMAVVFLVPFLLGWIYFRHPQRKVFLLIPITIIILAVVPFTIRNYNLWGQFLLLESQLGHVFWNGNHPESLGNFHPYRVFDIPAEVLASQNDAQITNQLLVMGINNVLNDPILFLSLTITRLREFFKFWPTSDSTSLANLLRVTSFGIMWPFAVAGIWLSRAHWRKLLPLYLFMVIHTSIYAVSWTMIRYRLPLDAILIIFAAFTIVDILEKYRPQVVERFPGLGR